MAAYLQAGNEWPWHNKTDDRGERTLGVWLHTQRIDYRAGKLSAAKEKQLNEIIPGWRQGRPRRGREQQTGGSIEHWMTREASANIFTDYNPFTVSDQTAYFGDLWAKWTNERDDYKHDGPPPASRPHTSEPPSPEPAL